MTYENLMRRLCVNFDRKSFSDEKSDLWFDKLRGFTERHLELTVKSIIEGHEKFPSRSVILSLMDRGAGVDLKEQETNNLERIKEDYYEHMPDPQYVEQAQTLIGKVPYLTREVYRCEMLEMDNKYPSRGWREQADECYHKRISMSQPSVEGADFP